MKKMKYTEYIQETKEKQKKSQETRPTDQNVNGEGVRLELNSNQKCLEIQTIDDVSA
jgi:hypothetical protein